MIKKLITTACAVAMVVAPLSAETDETAAWESLQDEAARLTENLPEDETAGKKILAERLTSQRDSFQKFLQAHPQSPNRWEARMALMQIGGSIAMLEDHEPDIAAQTSELESIANDTSAPGNIRADAGLVLLQIASMDFDRQRTEASARSLSAAINKFLETHPDDARAPALRLTEAQALEAFDPARASTIFQEVATDEDPEISGAAQTGLELLALRNKPLELSFTALDGSKFDVAKLRGKVVLVDFWATWCPPCVEEVPELVETYEKFRDKGFEIVGISLDQNKATLEKFLKENKMTWPQYFDGAGWENKIAQRFKIQSVPTMWLLDREGKLVDAAPRSRLEQAIEAALAKP
jgi:thiol-disulfide isomerase/thioredoxin